MLLLLLMATATAEFVSAEGPPRREPTQEEATAGSWAPTPVKTWLVEFDAGHLAVDKPEGGLPYLAFTHWKRVIWAPGHLQYVPSRDARDSRFICTPATEEGVRMWVDYLRTIGESADPTARPDNMDWPPMSAAGPIQTDCDMLAVQRDRVIYLTITRFGDGWSDILRLQGDDGHYRHLAAQIEKALESE